MLLDESAIAHDGCFRIDTREKAKHCSKPLEGNSSYGDFNSIVIMDKRKVVGMGYCQPWLQQLVFILDSLI